jgi:hypothetical protein
MLLTSACRDGKKDVAKHAFVADPSVTSKALEVSSFVGLLLCLVYVTAFRSLRMKIAARAWLIAS